MTACLVKSVVTVEPHPREDTTHLNVVRTNDAQFVSMKLEDNTPRYKVGDLVVHIPHGAILNDQLKDRLGAKENKIKAGNFRGFRSEGMLLPASEVEGEPVNEGEDVTARLGVTF